MLENPSSPWAYPAVFTFDPPGARRETGVRSWVAAWSFRT